MAISEGTILRIVLNLLWDDGNIMQNVFNAVLTTAGTSDDEDDVADDMAEWMDEIMANVVNRLSNELTAGEVTCYEYDAVDDDWDEFGSALATFVPAGTDVPLPHGVAALVRANSTDPDIQGKKYIGGLDESASQSGGWTSAVLTTLVALTVDWVTPFVGTTTAATFTPGVWSPTETVFKAFGATSFVNSIPAYQRRRKQGVGI